MKNQRSFSTPGAIVLTLCLCCRLLPIHAQQAPSETDRIQKLEEAVRRLQQQNETLTEEISRLREKAVGETAATIGVTVTTPSTNKPVFVLPWGKESKLALGGFVQANGEFGDAASFEGNFSDNPKGGAAHVPIHSRFRLRRARINVSGDFLENFDFKLEGDFFQSDGLNGGRTAFSGTDLFVNWHEFQEANIKAGQYKAPFGGQQNTPDTTTFTAERSLPTGALTPERQIGVQLWGKPLANLAPAGKELLEYWMGVFSGNNRNITINDDAHFMYVGRISSTPYAGTLFGRDTKWRLGADGFTSRYAKGTRISQTGNLLLNPLDGSLSAFSVPSDAEGTGWGIDQTFTFGPFDLVAEYLEENVRPKNSSAFKEFTANGYYVQGSGFFPGKKFQLVCKWESFNPGQAPHDNIDSITGGLNYYIKGDSVKLMLDYIHTWSEFRRHNRGTGQDEFDEILLRWQVIF